jgi:uncharacterized protein YqgV (UPF0045/DUF77 family)
MFSGVQFSLYPMTDDFVGVILDAIKAIDDRRDLLRIETDTISTLIVGPPEALFPALRDVFLRAAGTGHHCVLSATVSRGCPGEPDDPICLGTVGTAGGIGDRSWADALMAAAPATGQPVAAQFSLYPIGADAMPDIYACIDFLKTSGVFDRSKHFCTKLGGDAGAVFAAVDASFRCFGAADGHVTVDLTVSANSPSG